jgi:hypothetical protein
MYIGHVIYWSAARGKFVVRWINNLKKLMCCISMSLPRLQQREMHCRGQRDNAVMLTLPHSCSCYVADEFNLGWPGRANLRSSPLEALKYLLILFFRWWHKKHGSSRPPIMTHILNGLSNPPLQPLFQGGSQIWAVAWTPLPPLSLLSHIEKSTMPPLLSRHCHQLDMNWANQGSDDQDMEAQGETPSQIGGGRREQKKLGPDGRD